MYVCVCMYVCMFIMFVREREHYRLFLMLILHVITL